MNTIFLFTLILSGSAFAQDHSQQQAQFDTTQRVYSPEYVECTAGNDSYTFHTWPERSFSSPAGTFYGEVWLGKDENGRALAGFSQLSQAQVDEEGCSLEEVPWARLEIVNGKTLLHLGKGIENDSTEVIQCASQSSPVKTIEVTCEWGVYCGSP